MPARDPLTYLLTANASLLHSLLASAVPLSHSVFVRLEPGGTLHIFATAEAEAEHVLVPRRHRRAVLAEIAKPRPDDELLLLSIVDGKLIVTRVDRARIARDVGPRLVMDPRNHFPMPWPMGWHGPYALETRRDTYRIDTPDCMVAAWIEPEAWDFNDIDLEGNPRHMWLLEIAVDRAMDSAPASDEQVAEITARFRHCGPWFDRTSHHPRRHPKRRFFGAEIGAHREGMPWPEVQPLPRVMLGPPPGWEPVGSFEDRPLVFRIEGTKLRVEWTPPPGVDGFEAATGRASEPSRFIVSAEGRKPTDEEASTVFAMLGGAAFEEEKRPRAAAKGKARARVFRATAGWLRRSSGRA